MEKPKGKLLILSGPSGVGKDTVLDAWRARNPRVQRVVAYTTRAPRSGEVDGIDYYFVTTERFHQMASEGAFLEHKEVHGNFYATPLTDMLSLLDAGKIAVLKIDVQGALTVMEKLPEALTLFLLPPDLEALEARIRGRATDTDDVIQKRLQNARHEMAHVHYYQHQLTNLEVEQVINELEGIVGS